MLLVQTNWLMQPGELVTNLEVQKNKSNTPFTTPFHKRIRCKHNINTFPSGTSSSAHSCTNIQPHTRKSWTLHAKEDLTPRSVWSLHTHLTQNGCLRSNSFHKGRIAKWAFSPSFNKGLLSPFTLIFTICSIYWNNLASNGSKKHCFRSQTCQVQRCRP